MKKLAVAGGLIALAGLIIFIVSLCIYGWSDSSNYDMKEFSSQNVNTAVDIEIEAGKVQCEYYDGDKIVVQYPDGGKLKTSISESNGTLHIESKLKWYAHFGINFGLDKFPAMTIKLPRSTAFALDLDMSAGSVEIGDGNYKNMDIHVSAGSCSVGKIVGTAFNGKISAGKISVSEATCDSLYIKMSAGKVSVGKIVCDSTEIKVSAGSADLGFAGEKGAYSIDVDKSAGSCNVSDQTVTGGKKIKIDLSAGSVDCAFGK